MTRERAISEVMQIYGYLSPDKQQALDVLIQGIPKADIQKAIKETEKNIREKVLTIIREEYISKAEYEARLKADMLNLLEDLNLQIDESAAYNLEVAKIQRLIRDKIDKLRGEA